MTLTFVSPLVVSKSRFASIARTSVCARTARLNLAPKSRTRFATVVCASLPKEKQVSNEEEVLDETAMRAAEIHEVLIGLKDFKERIVDDATKLAKKVRAPRKQLEAALAAHPDIVKIDGHIAELEEELKVLGDR